MAKSIAINVAANTNLPGFRGPIYPDGQFVYLPIPEREPTVETVPTYGDLLPKLDPLPFSVDDNLHDRRVHLDPEFAEYPACSRYTYGDEHGVKAGPLAALEPGDSLFFYATLTRHEPPAGVDTGPPVDWVAPDWGAYLIGEFRVDRVFDAEACADLSAFDRHGVASNAHCERDPFDAKVLVVGTDDSRLFDRAVPLSAPEAGATANRLVTGLSNDSGKGPWWRRRLWFDAEATDRLRAIVDGEVPI
ncbi:hypothetical protein [Halohasta salina]|uniref:Nmad3 family putative nucleotide modification protein n=1 Tax=Halohasta salina TaxID=2961621 RepID=UPI003CCC932A